ncbi:hypothetical protein EI969_14665 [Pseudomonas sp. PB101]|nr:hypothetical protein [Pseudomonas sp. PB101]
MLAMDVNDNEPSLDDCVVQTFFASKLAPTGVRSAVVALALRSSVKTASARNYWGVQPPR